MPKIYLKRIFFSLLVVAKHTRVKSSNILFATRVCLSQEVVVQRIPRLYMSMNQDQMNFFCKTDTEFVRR